MILCAPQPLINPLFLILSRNMAIAGSPVLHTRSMPCAFCFKERNLFLCAAIVAACFPIGADHAVAGDFRIKVLFKNAANSAGGIGASCSFCDFFVGEHFSFGNTPDDAVDGITKFCHCYLVSSARSVANVVLIVTASWRFGPEWACTIR